MKIVTVYNITTDIIYCLQVKFQVVMQKNVTEKRRRTILLSPFLFYFLNHLDIVEIRQLQILPNAENDQLVIKVDSTLTLDCIDQNEFGFIESVNEMDVSSNDSNRTSILITSLNIIILTIRHYFNCSVFELRYFF